MHLGIFLVLEVLGQFSLKNQTRKIVTIHKKFWTITNLHMIKCCNICNIRKRNETCWSKDVTSIRHNSTFWVQNLYTFFSHVKCLCAKLFWILSHIYFETIFIKIRQEKLSNCCKYCVIYFLEQNVFTKLDKKDFEPYQVLIYNFLSE